MILYYFNCDRCDRPFRSNSHRSVLCSKCQPLTHDWARPMTTREVYAAGVRVEAALQW